MATNYIDVLHLTGKYMAEKKRLPVLKEKFFYPTEASVKITNSYGEPEVLGTCMRAAYYRYTGEETPKENSGYTNWIFFSGKALEENLIETWKQLGIWVDNNIKFISGEHHVSGELDCVIRNPIDDTLVLCEIKTYYGYDATKQLVGNPKKNISGKPKDNNLLQICLYLYFHQEMFPYGKLIYLDKTCKDNVEFTIELISESSEAGEKTFPVIDGVIDRRFCIEDVLARFQELRTYINNKQLPPREFELEYSDERVEELFKRKEISKTAYEEWQKGKRKPGDWNCSYCNFKESCWQK